MARYIDADVLDDEVMHLVIAITGNPKQHTVVNECKSSFRKMIEEQPTADVAPSVHGEWIPQDMTYTKFMCNQCNSKNHSGHEKFCPNCGADMRKKVE